MDLFIRWLQIQLSAHGFTSGPIDGIDGKLTRAALRAFQDAEGLAVTGTTTEATIRELRSDPTEYAPAIPERDEELATGPITGAWPRQSDCPAYYGAVGENQTRIAVPWDLYLAWDKGTRITHITVHEKVAASATRALQKVRGLYSDAELRDLGLHLFGGSLAVRKMRGGSNWSMHSWGIAIDFDPERNQLSWKRPAARLSQPDAVPFWQAWEAEGWVSLGRARDFDWMHVQAARL